MSRPWRPWVALLGILLLEAVAFDTPAAPAKSPSFTILEIEGKVEFHRAGSLPTVWDRAYTNQILQAGDSLRVGLASRAVVGPPSIKGHMRINEGGLVEVLAEPEASFNLLRGILYFFHREKPATLRLRTPTIATAIWGTEFNLKVEDDGRTTLSLIEGEVEMRNPLGQIRLGGGEEGVAEPGKPPRKTALLNARNIIQWALYYPGVLDVEELNLAASDQAALCPSLAAWRSGDLHQALEQYPTNRLPASDAEKVYRAALLLAVGQVEQTEALLGGVDRQEARMVALGNALRTMIASVKGQKPAVTGEKAEVKLASAWLAESYFLQSQSDLEGALKAARQAVAKSPQFGFGWARVAELEFSFGRTAKALEALAKALELAPRNAQAVALKGFLLSAQNNITAALNYFDQAIALDGALGNAWLGRGLCKIRQGKVAAGQEDLETAVTLEPQRSLLRSYLGKAFSQIGAPDRARKELALAQKLDPQDPTAWLYSALQNQQQNRINEAVGDLGRSQELNANRGLYRSHLLLDQDRAVRSANLATIYRDAGLNEVSLREAARAVSADYANYSAHLFLANSYNQMRDPKLINQRYETPMVSEYLLATLLAPVGGGPLAPAITQQEYSKLFERNRLGLVSSTEYFSRGDWIQYGAQYGTFGNSSYSADAYYRTENGQRPNNDLEQRVFSLQLKQQLSPSDSVYVQAVVGRFEGGDLAQRYEPTNANPAVRTLETQEPLLLAGYHHEWQPGVHTLVLATRLQDTYKVANPQQGLVALRWTTNGVIDLGRNIAMDQRYRSELEIYTVEAQQIVQREPHTFIFGGRYQRGDFATRNLHTWTPGSFYPAPMFTNDWRKEFTSDLERISLYGYWQWEIAPPLRFMTGVSYDRLHFPGNHRFGPISNQENTKDRVSPKVGVVWTPAKNTTLRAAYSRSLGGVSLDQNFQLEPAQLAGFNQSWRSIIPESVGGANAGPKFESGGMALDQQFPTRTYLGLSAEWLKSEVNRVVGVYDLLPNRLPDGQPRTPPRIVPASTPEQLGYEEKTFTATLNQLLGEEWSLGASYRLSQADLALSFPQVPAVLDTRNGFRPRQDLGATLHQVNLFALFNHRCGFFAEFQSVWNMQRNRGYGPYVSTDGVVTPDIPGDAFWQFNLYAGYRFPRRQAELRLGLLNLADQDYRLNPLNLTAEFPRERTFMASFRCAF